MEWSCRYLSFLGVATESKIIEKEMFKPDAHISDPTVNGKVTRWRLRVSSGIQFKVWGWIAALQVAHSVHD